MPLEHVASDIQVRRLSADDSLEELTSLLHSAYKTLGDRGMEFVAVDQDVETTRYRATLGECFVAVQSSRLIGTITLYPPGVRTHCDWYRRLGVAVFGQFGVGPHAQGKGVGRTLLKMIEQRAMELGATDLALDTAKPAAHLIELYERWGFEVVQEVQWDGANYASVIMNRRLSPSA